MNYIFFLVSTATFENPPLLQYLKFWLLCCVQVSIFATADAAFLRHLTLMMKSCIFLPGEYIVHKGDMGLGMFFLYHGTVSHI